MFVVGTCWNCFIEAVLTYIPWGNWENYLQTLSINSAYLVLCDRILVMNGFRNKDGQNIRFSSFL